MAKPLRQMLPIIHQSACQRQGQILSRGTAHNGRAPPPGEGTRRTINRDVARCFWWQIRAGWNAESRFRSSTALIVCLILVWSKWHRRGEGEKSYSTHCIIGTWRALPRKLRITPVMVTITEYNIWEISLFQAMRYELRISIRYKSPNRLRSLNIFWNRVQKARKGDKSAKTAVITIVEFGRKTQLIANINGALERMEVWPPTTHHVKRVRM